MYHYRTRSSMLTLAGAGNTKILAWMIGHELVQLNQYIKVGAQGGVGIFLRHEIEAHTWNKTNAARFSIPKRWIEANQKQLEYYQTQCKVTWGCGK